jgi:hypothetical protein
VIIAEKCDHAGWGRYEGEEGLCPPPAKMTGCAHHRECPACGYRVTFVGSCTCATAPTYEAAVVGGYEVR